MGIQYSTSSQPLNLQVRLEKLEDKFGEGEKSSERGWLDSLSRLELLEVKIFGKPQPKGTIPARLAHLETAVATIEDGLERLEAIYGQSTLPGAAITETVGTCEKLVLGNDSCEGSLSSLYREIFRSVDYIDIDNVNLDRIDDTGRMLQREYDDAVVELACANYEAFYMLASGTAKFNTVNATSAGIRGWAASVLDNRDNAEDASEDKAELQLDRQTLPLRGDEIEARQYREALLKSLGSQPPCDESKGMPRAGDFSENDVDASYDYSTENDDDTVCSCDTLDEQGYGKHNELFLIHQQTRVLSWGAVDQ